MTTLNLRAFTSAFAALALTVALSWTFVEATSLANMERSSGAGLLAVVSALVR